ncbi:hypothetical protein GCM10022254_57240 [Actinomadura meridiana]|uniref:Uncharacterized protein n=1 Tax=Actinomadura meridiana TaxID=559626 RepID=A0ABP8CGG9_9ACTN
MAPTGAALIAFSLSCPCGSSPRAGPGLLERQIHCTEGAQQLRAAGRCIALQRAVAVQATGMTFSTESAEDFVHERPVQVGKVTKGTTLNAK